MIPIIISYLTKMKTKFMNGIKKCYRDPFKGFLFTSIIIISLIKLFLIGDGFFGLIDESIYHCSGRVVLFLKEFNIKDALREIYSTKGRPGEAILKIIPHTFQFISSDIFHLKWYESKNSYPLFIYNFAIYCFTLFIHFKVSNILLKNKTLALLSVLLYCSLTNSYIYLRHATPYDASLLILYLALYKIVKNIKNEKLTFIKSLFLGNLAFFGYLVYPGYFPLIFICVFMLFFVNLKKENFLNNLYHACCFLIGCALCLVFFETLARIVGCSYLMEAMRISSTITQGSFDESFSFIFKYLFEVETLTGLIIIAGLILFVTCIYRIIYKKKIQDYSLVLLLGGSTIFIYLAYACAGYFFHKMIFYGRLLHQYLPVICIFAVFSINYYLKDVKRNQRVYFIISIFLIINFCANFYIYKSFAYPRDVYWKYCKSEEIKNIDVVCESDYGWPVIPVNEDTLHDPEMIIVNGCHMYPYNDITKTNIYKPKAGYQLLESRPHFLNFKAYQYEGFDIVDRDNFDKTNFQIKVYSKKDF